MVKGAIANFKESERTEARVDWRLVPLPDRTARFVAKAGGVAPTSAT